MTRGFEEDRCSPLGAGALLYPPPRCRRPAWAVQIRSAVDLVLVTDEPGLAGHSSGRRWSASLLHLWPPSDGTAGRSRSNRFNCSATASVSYPSSLRNSPNGNQGHPWFTPAAESHPVPSRVKQCSTRSQIYSTIGIGWQKMHKAVEAWKQKKIHK
jgi:hypothetical protein